MPKNSLERRLPEVCLSLMLAPIGAKAIKTHWALAPSEIDHA